MNEHLTLLELNTRVARAVRAAFPAVYWVEAELLSLREVRGHCYMEVVEKDSTTATLVAKASAKCWQSRWREVASRFVAATGGLPQAGMKLLLSVQVDFHASYGFSLIVQDIDATYTLGDMARRRQEIIAKLKADGAYDLQRALTLPLFCQHIAVISSATAAGYGDFCQQIDNNAYGFAFTHTLFPALMQGEQTSTSIIAQLDAIARRKDEFDCVVIIRGGGATADLSSFDDLPLAESVAHFPLPIITGIGHDRDECVLDLIAHRRVKTPTAAAAFLIDHLLVVWSKIVLAQETITTGVTTLLDSRRHRLEQMALIVQSGTSLFLTRQRALVDSTAVRLGTSLTRYFDTHRHRLSLLTQRVDSLDPAVLLQRGYSMTTVAGHIVKSVAQLHTGQVITSVFADGSVQSIIQ